MNLDPKQARRHWGTGGIAPNNSIIDDINSERDISELLFMVMDAAIWIFADDTTIFAADSCLNRVLERLETDAIVLSKWFLENFIELTEGKCYLLTFGTIQSNIKFKIGDAIVEESSEEKLLGLILDKKLISKVIF